jgi:hypothetical protein
MGPFPKSGKFEDILVVVDYVNKWVEALRCRTADHKSSIRIFEETNISEIQYAKVSDK